MHAMWPLLCLKQHSTGKAGMSGTAGMHVESCTIPASRSGYASSGHTRATLMPSRSPGQTPAVITTQADSPARHCSCRTRLCYNADTPASSMPDLGCMCRAPAATNPREAVCWHSVCLLCMPDPVLSFSPFTNIQSHRQCTLWHHDPRQ